MLLFTSRAGQKQICVNCFANGNIGHYLRKEAKNATSFVDRRIFLPIYQNMQKPGTDCCLSVPGFVQQASERMRFFPGAFYESLF